MRIPEARTTKTKVNLGQPVPCALFGQNAYDQSVVGVGWKLVRLWRITKGCEPFASPRVEPAANSSPGTRQKIMSTTVQAPKGLEGVVATNSSICYIDGERGVLAYRGIDIHELADHSNFEETCFLLWFEQLPKAAELKDLRGRLAAEPTLDPAIITLLNSAPKSAVPMDVLRTAVSALSFYDADNKNNDHEANVRKAIRLTSQIA